MVETTKTGGTNVMHWKRVTLCAAVCMVGCGDDPASPSAEQLTGEWTYVVTALTGGGITCDVRDASLSLSGSGDAFSGSTANGTLVCSVGGAQADPIPLEVGTVAGRVSDGVVTFTITQGPNVIQHEGTLSGGVVQGSVNSSIDFGVPAGVVISTGFFSATRR